MSRRARGQIKNVAASVHQLLLDRSRRRREDFQLTLVHYALERLLYRLSRSAYRDRFVLKGALLITLWEGGRYRATRDLDLLGQGDNAVPTLTTIFAHICRTRVDDDGLEFSPDAIQGEEIREAGEYQGVRLVFTAHLGPAKIPVQVDIGFGDAVIPNPEPVDYPTMLDFPSPNVLGYPREAVVAEKYQALVVLGIKNSRMKDFYDIWFLSENFAFDGLRLTAAIRSTFGRRHTELPSKEPLAFTSEFSENPTKQTQWTGFLKRSGISHPLSLGEAVVAIRAFLFPITRELVQGKPFGDQWPAKGPWQGRPAARWK